MAWLKIVILCLFLLASQQASCSQIRFGESLCHDSDYFCMKIRPHDTWERLFPESMELDVVQRVNRMNVPLKAGMVIAVPKNIEHLTIYDVSPFPRTIPARGEKIIFVSQEKLAWGAYDEQGDLLWWGPISSGSGKCTQSDGGCLTPSGSFRIIRKQDDTCVSTAFPIQTEDEFSGGAPMPYCMHFFRGFALHGSDVIPGYRASHGCVRMFVEDARWLNEDFIQLPGNGNQGTQVIIGSLDE